MSKARELAELGAVYDSGALSNRNVIINGNFDVWQRGSSSISSDGFFADRWQMLLSGSTATASQESFTLGQTDVPNNPSYFAKLDVTTGNNQARLEHRVEYVTTFAGQTTTLSFYAKGTNPNGGTVEVDLTHRYGSGGSSPVSVTKTITLTSSWQQFTLNFDVPSVSGKTIGAGDYVQLSWRQPAADTSTNAWDISLSQVQWELGTEATPFEHRSYGDELARCQRYYQIIAGGVGIGASSTSIETSFTRKEMRAAPSGAATGTVRFEDPTVANYTQSSGSVIITTASARSEKCQFNNFSGLTSTRSYFMKSDSGLLALDAEL